MAERPERISPERLLLAAGKPSKPKPRCGRRCASIRETVPARVNLADVYRLVGRDDEGEKVLSEAVRLAPGAADVAHALGLLYVRLGRKDDALRCSSAPTYRPPAWPLRLCLRRRSP